MSHVSALIVLTLARFLTDTNSQVRKTSQAALLVLLEQGLVDTNDVVEQVRVVNLEMLSLITRSLSLCRRVQFSFSSLRQTAWTLQNRSRGTHCQNGSLNRQRERGKNIS